MAKTRSQVLSSTVKKEEHEDKTKLEQLLHSTSNAPKSKNKITKNKKPIQALNAGVKSENVEDNKAPVASPKKGTFKTRITTEQITKLIGYIVNDKVSVRAASRKVGLSYLTAYKYYHEYQDDPEHRIPLPKTRLNKPLSMITQEKIDNLVRYIVNDGMNTTQASNKVNISSITAAKYYAKYLEDPEHKIPLLAHHTGDSSRRHTQEEIADLIGYIVRDNMTIVEASKKVNMSRRSAKRYYLQYLYNPNSGIPDPHKSSQRSGKRCTNDQVSSLIGYIVNDGMTLLEASVKASMGRNTALRYYRLYLDDPKNNIPTPESSKRRVSNNPLTVDQVKNFFCYVIIDKLSVPQASRKAKIARTSGQRYYDEYLKSPNNQAKIKDMTFSVDKMKRFITLVQNDKMSFRKAADVVDMNMESARRQYHQYLKNPQYKFPVMKTKKVTQEDIQKLIDNIERGKMNVNSAAASANMEKTTARRYYRLYQNDPEHKIPAPLFLGKTRKNNTFNKFTQIIADIYKNNPTIKPIHERHHSELDGSDINIKQESVEEDKKCL